MLGKSDLLAKIEEVKASRVKVEAELESLLKNLHAHEGAIQILESLLEQADKPAEPVEE